MYEPVQEGGWVQLEALESGAEILADSYEEGLDFVRQETTGDFIVIDIRELITLAESELMCENWPYEQDSLSIRLSSAYLFTMMEQLTEKTVEECIRSDEEMPFFTYPEVASELNEQNKGVVLFGFEELDHNDFSQEDASMVKYAQEFEQKDGAKKKIEMILEALIDVSGFDTTNYESDEGFNKETFVVTVEKNILEPRRGDIIQNMSQYQIP
jgi:hypothetical protein